jgi:hypothetical protein
VIDAKGEAGMSASQEWRERRLREMLTRRKIIGAEWKALGHDPYFKTPKELEEMKRYFRKREREMKAAERVRP